VDDLIKEIEAFEKEPNIIKVFGAIIYSNSHPHIKKILRDEDYWHALEDISGNLWAIFAVKAKEGHKEIRGGGPPGSLSMMVSVWVEPNENKKLIEYLEIQSTESPLFVIFTRLKTGKILKSTLDLDDSSVENAFNRLREIIQGLTFAVKSIDKENIENYEPVFNAINMTVERIRNWDKVKKAFKIYQWVKKTKP
jgi:hypothetical protein